MVTSDSANLLSELCRNVPRQLPGLFKHFRQGLINRNVVSGKRGKPLRQRGIPRYPHYSPRLCLRPFSGCFTLLNAGQDPVTSNHGLVTTLGCDAEGQPVYCLEGSVFIAGAVVQWLRDEMKLIATAPDSEGRATAVEDNSGVYFVPAFVGLGAPYWDQDARAIITGLTRGTGPDHIIRAALESIAYQSRDLIDALQADLGDAAKLTALRVDGGAAKNDFLMQFQADILGIDVVRPTNIETTAQGAAFLAGLGAGFWSSFAEVEQVLGVDRTFTPAMDDAQRDALFAGWQAAVGRCRSK